MSNGPISPAPSTSRFFSPRDLASGRAFLRFMLVFFLAHVVLLLVKELRKPSGASWTLEEKQNIAHYQNSLRALDQFAKWARLHKAPDGSDAVKAAKYVQEARLFYRKALMEAKAVKPELLAKAHPDLPAAFRERYMPILEALDRNAVHQFLDLGRRWTEWYARNEIRIPDDVGQSSPVDVSHIVGQPSDIPNPWRK